MVNQPSNSSSAPDEYVTLLEVVKATADKLLNENQALRTAIASRNQALERLEAKVHTIQTSTVENGQSRSRGTTRRRNRPRVIVPLLCRRETRKSYKTLLKKEDFAGFNFDETLDSDYNQDVKVRTVRDVLHRNGSENCAWTLAVVEEALQRYYLSLSEKEKKKNSNTYEAHQRKCRKQGRRREKLTRRTAALELVHGWDNHKKGQAAEILIEDAMSSEESEFEEMDGKRKLVGYNVKKLSWQSNKVTKIKRKLDKEYKNSLTKRALDRLLPRKEANEISERPAPNGVPEWAISAS